MQCSPALLFLLYLPRSSSSLSRRPQSVASERNRMRVQVGAKEPWCSACPLTGVPLLTNLTFWCLRLARHRASDPRKVTMFSAGNSDVGNGDFEDSAQSPGRGKEG